MRLNEKRCDGFVEVVANSGCGGCGGVVVWWCGGVVVWDGF